MFGRKNQSILSEHYTKLVDHELDGNATDGDDDIITLKRADHDLPSDLPLNNSLSKRKLKMGTSKKAMLKLRGMPHKLVFDEAGQPHEVYEIRDAEDEFKDKDVMKAGLEFAEGERDRLREADVRDKQEAKEKKKEKKRKRKERERLVGSSSRLLGSFRQGHLTMLIFDRNEGKVLPVRFPVAKLPASLRSLVAGLIQTAFAVLASILSRWTKTVVGLEM